MKKSSFTLVVLVMCLVWILAGVRPLKADSIKFLKDYREFTVPFGSELTLKEAREMKTAVSIFYVDYGLKRDRIGKIEICNFSKNSCRINFYLLRNTPGEPLLVAKLESNPGPIVNGRIDGYRWTYHYGNGLDERGSFTETVDDGHHYTGEFNALELFYFRTGPNC